MSRGRPGVLKPQSHKAAISAALLARGIGKAPKRCPTCKSVKPRSDYGVRRNGYSRAECRACELAAWKQWRRDNPEKVVRHQRRADLWLRFSITIEQYEQMRSAQEGVCAICKKPPHRLNLDVDHDHATNTLRDLLCSRCNILLGGANDSIELLLKAAEYLKRHQAVPSDHKITVVPHAPSRSNPRPGNFRSGWRGGPRAPRVSV